MPMFAGRKLFIATPAAYAVTIGQNSTWPGYAARRTVVREPGEERLAGLEHEPGDDVAGRDVPDLIPSVLQPADHVNSEQVQEDDDERNADEPGADLDQAPPARRVVEREHRRGLDGSCAHVRPNRSSVFRPRQRASILSVRFPMLTFLIVAAASRRSII